MIVNTDTITRTTQTLREQVLEGYGRIASASGSPSEGSRADCYGGGCCGPVSLDPQQLAAAIGYSSDDLAVTPEGANMGLSCGNPTAIASLRSGEVVVDLGSGGGFDCFIAGPKVGATGRVIGVDMTPQMLSKARRNLEIYRSQSGLDNVEFRLGEIEHLPVADNSVDVVISNCVLNLSPDKPQVWREIARVLKPGGRVAISDLALLQRLPENVQQDVEALIGCIAGAVLIEQTRSMIVAAGLVDVRLTPKRQYVESLTDFQDPLYAKLVAKLEPGAKASDYVTSLDMAATKPGSCCGSDCCR
jgi:arsenite methyltransferase